MCLLASFLSSQIASQILMVSGGFIHDNTSVREPQIYLDTNDGENTYFTVYLFSVSILKLLLPTGTYHLLQNQYITTTMHKFIPTTLLVLAIASQCEGFTSIPLTHQRSSATSTSTRTTVTTQLQASRRESLNQLAFAFGIGSILQVIPQQAMAAADKDDSTIYKSGKTPKVPGEKPKDKNDTNGTRKDGSFLRSISSCKSQCEQTTDKDGFARSKEECLSDCQDICCTTYEQW